MRRALAVAFAAGALVVPVVANAFTDGDFARVCVAPNWKTGDPERVAELNVPLIPGGYHAYTSRAEGGRWLIRWNVPKMANTPKLMRRFLFYHECAHAKHNTRSERIADCEGLRAMASDIGVTEQALLRISDFYASLGRIFPPPGCSL